MSIQFSCESCGQSLKVPEGSSGKKVRCPQCEAVNIIPDASDGGSPFSTPASSEPELSPRGDDTQNPFAAPMTHTSARPAYDGSPFSGELTHQTFELGDVVEQAWRRFKPRLGMAALFGIIFVAASMGSGFIGQVIQLGVGAAGIEWLVIVAIVLSQVIQQVIGAYLQCVSKRFGLNVARGNPELMSGIFSFDRVIRVVLTFLLFGFVFALVGGIVSIPFGIGYLIDGGAGGTAMIVGVAISGLLGVIAFVAGIFYMLRFVLSIFFILDRDAGVIESLRLSYQYMTGNSLTWFVTMLVMGLLCGIVTILTCFIGGLFVVGFMETMQSVIYLKVTGQYQNVDA